MTCNECTFDLEAIQTCFNDIWERFVHYKQFTIIMSVDVYAAIYADVLLLKCTWNTIARFMDLPRHQSRSNRMNANRSSFNS